MLEKIGLPPKPSARGRSWVIDASHCQQCASQFSIFNRKHHCRRCGGLFCNNCVLARMMLRGQGDSPVRICEPCKKLEEAARFEARHGRKKKDESGLESDELLLRSLLNDGSETPSSSGAGVEPVTPELLRQSAQEAKMKYVALKKEGRSEEATKAFKRSKELERQADALALALRKKRVSKISAGEQQVSEAGVSTQTTTTVRRSSGGDEELLKELKDLGWSEGDLNPKQATDADILREGGGGKPGKTVGALQMEILGHKRKALALKREGKLAEAKEELKLAKTLERRVEEIETLGEDVDEEDDGDELSAIMKALEKEAEQSHGKPVPLSAESLPIVKEDEDDEVDVSDTDMSDPEMLAALKAMGWAEESRVLESFSAPVARPSREELQAQILAHKRKALALKRAGDLAEARKELSQAKSLEQILDSSRSSEAEVVIQEESEQVEVTENDMRDPEMLAALRALGFGGEDQELVTSVKVQAQDKRLLQQDVAAVKRFSEAALKRDDTGGHNFQDQHQLQSKLNTRVRAASFAPSSPSDDEEEDVMNYVKDLSADSEVAAMLKGLTLDEKIEEAATPVSSDSKTRKASRKRVTSAVELPNKSKRELQQELLGKKRKALTLRREGKEEEAEKELKEASVLEMQMKALEEAENAAPQRLETKDEEGEEEDDDENDEVTEDDMNDPALVAALSSMGFKDDQSVVAPQEKTKVPPPEAKVDAADDDTTGFEGEYGEIGQVVDIVPPFFSELLKPNLPGIFSPKKQEVDTSPTKQQQVHIKQQQQRPDIVPAKQPQVLLPLPSKQQQQFPDIVPTKPQQVQLPSPSKQQQVVPLPRKQEQVHHVQQQDGRPSSGSSSGIEQEILEHKRKALRLKRSGDVAGAKEELRLAKVLEKSLQNNSSTSETKLVEEKKVATANPQKHSSAGQTQQTGGRFKDRMKLQQESLGHKRKALALRREGKTEEAEAEFELAKSLEKQMEEMEGSQIPPAARHEEGVEDVMDPQLAAALAGLGFNQSDIFTTPSAAQPRSTPQPKSASQSSQTPKSSPQAPQLDSSVQEKIRALRLRAVELKRSGKQQEALQALRDAKRLEKGI